MRALLTGSSKLRGLPLSYFLLMERNSERAIYGLAVQYGKERVAFPELSRNCGDVVDLLERMWSGQVTPVTAADVIEDWRVM